VADDLAVKAFDEFLFEPGEPPCETGPGPQANQMRGFRDLCRVVTEFNAGMVRINPTSSLQLVRGAKGRSVCCLHANSTWSEAPTISGACAMIAPISF